MANGLQGTAFGHQRRCTGIRLMGYRIHQWRAGFQYLIPETVPRAQQQQLLPGQFIPGDLLFLSQVMAGRQQHHKGFIVQRQGQNLRLLKRQRDDNGIQFGMAQFLAEIGCVVLFNEQGHMGCRPAQFRQQVRKQVGADSVDGTHFQGGIQLVFAILRHILDNIDLVQNPLGLLDDPLAGIGDPDIAFAALE